MTTRDNRLFSANMSHSNNLRVHAHNRHITRQFWSHRSWTDVARSERHLPVLFGHAFISPSSELPLFDTTDGLQHV